MFCKTKDRELLKELPFLTAGIVKSWRKLMRRLVEAKVDILLLGGCCFSLNFAINEMKLC